MVKFILIYYDDRERYYHAKDIKELVEFMIECDILDKCQYYNIIEIKDFEII